MLKKWSTLGSLFETDDGSGGSGGCGVVMKDEAEMELQGAAYLPALLSFFTSVLVGTVPTTETFPCSASIAIDSIPARNRRKEASIHQSFIRIRCTLHQKLAKLEEPGDLMPVSLTHYHEMIKK
jgi:hypothetical protein